MRKTIYPALAIVLLSVTNLMTSTDALGCTNVIITKGASADGSCMISYAADSHWLYGELYFRPAGKYRPGTMLDIRDWDSNRPLGQIPQAAVTFQTVGNMNEHQLIIAETTWGGREEQIDNCGIMDYGSLIYITLQRARTARAAIDTIVNLANRYGYPSEGETFSIADPEEAWIMDLVGKGSAEKGIVWVARRIPDGYICAHANQARIGRIDFNDPDNCRYAPDVIDYARRMGYFRGDDASFSFREAYCPPDFGTVRGCDARVWSAFNTLCDGIFTVGTDVADAAFSAFADGVPGAGVVSGSRNDKAGVADTGGVTDGTVSRSADEYLDYAMGYNLSGALPLFVKPSRKISAKDVADVMRDHFEGTPMDMTTDIGAGGNACPYRWRPMEFEYGGDTYVNERAIATQQTGFWFVAQARGYLPDIIGSLIWFGCDDAATSYLTPVYVNTSGIPESLREGNGDLLHYSPTSQFWMCNRVTNACYKMYDKMAPVVRRAADEFERGQMLSAVPEFDARALSALRRGASPSRIRKMLTRYTIDTAASQFNDWTLLEQTLLVKFIDGNIKAQNEDGTFVHSKWSEGIPEGLTQPGYTEIWKRAVVNESGEKLRVR